MKSLVTTMLVACLYGFIFLYIPDGILAVLSQRLGAPIGALVKLGAGLPILLILGSVLFAQDHLPNGTSKASKFYRFHYASAYAVAEYGLQAARATTLWFDYFNKWAAPDHACHRYYVTNFDRSYSLRLIYYLKRALVVFIVAAILSVVSCTWVIPTTTWGTLLATQIVIVVVALAVLLWLLLPNRFWENGSPTCYGDRYGASGAYEKYREITGILRTKFEEDVLKHLDSGGGDP